MPPPGLDALRHVVVVMMENRSFDQLTGALKATGPAIDGIDGTQSNPDTQGNLVKAEPKAKYQSQLDPDPGHDFDSTCPRAAGARGDPDTPPG